MVNYVSNIWDFWDTIFIVLVKIWRQLSFLHVYHHFTIFLFYWLNGNSPLYDGDVYLTIILNGFIHTVMYTSYFVYIMHTKDPKTAKSIQIWWKSTLTSLQLIQFVTMMVSQVLYVLTHTSNKCQRNTSYLLYIVFLFILFAKFFVISYMKAKRKSD